MEHGLHRPQICRLPNEGRPMDLLQTRKEVLVVPPKVGEYRRIGVFLEKLSDKLAGKHHAVSNRRVWASGTERAPFFPELLFEVSKHLIGETEHLDDKAIEAHDWSKGLILWSLLG